MFLFVFQEPAAQLNAVKVLETVYFATVSFRRV
jgi:hypothetical protein